MLFNCPDLLCCARRGAPHSAKDLETVAAAHAKTVILLHPDDDEVRQGTGG